MTLRLRVLGGQHHGDIIDFVEPRQIMIGRNPSSDIVLGGGNASRRHARINWDGDNLMLTDLESRNGVTVNDETMTRQCVLSAGDSVCLGGCELRIEDTENRAPGIGSFDPLAMTVDED